MLHHFQTHRQLLPPVITSHASSRHSATLDTIFHAPSFPIVISSPLPPLFSSFFPRTARPELFYYRIGLFHRMSPSRRPVATTAPISYTESPIVGLTRLIGLYYADTSVSHAIHCITVFHRLLIIHATTLPTILVIALNNAELLPLIILRLQYRRLRLKRLAIFSPMPLKRHIIIEPISYFIVHAHLAPPVFSFHARLHSFDMPRLRTVLPAHAAHFLPRQRCQAGCFAV